jgi:hypothetical protein
MTGSTPFSLEKSANFGRSFKKLVKALKHLDLVAIVGSCLEGLMINPYPPKSRESLCPKGQICLKVGRFIS